MPAIANDFPFRLFFLIKNNEMMLNIKDKGSIYITKDIKPKTAKPASGPLSLDRKSIVNKIKGITAITNPAIANLLIFFFIFSI